MNKIESFKTKDEAEAAGFGLKLSDDEASALETKSPSEKQILLMWFTFWNNQRKTRPSKWELPMRHAFITGCRAMAALLTKGK